MNIREAAPREQACTCIYTKHEHFSQHISTTYIAYVYMQRYIQGDNERAVKPKSPKKNLGVELFQKKGRYIN